MLIALLFAALPYHLQLEASPAAPFPFLSKFGTITLHVYNGGVRADTMWLNGFSRNGTRFVTVENPFLRMYTNVPVHELVTMLRKMSNENVQEGGPPPMTAPVPGHVHGIPAKRYRMLYGADAWIDLWTTDRIPQNPQLRMIVDAFVTDIAPQTAKVMRSIGGTPVYVELNFSHYHKLPLVRLKSYVATNAGQEKALSVGKLYFHVPLLEALWK